ncbi:hypothetical protein D3C72_1106360 [compost metagenome]
MLPKTVSFFCVTPITRAGMEPRNTTCPIGSVWVPNRARRVLSSITTSCARRATLVSSKNLPCASLIARTRKYCSPTPWIAPFTDTLRKRSVLLVATSGVTLST